MKIYIDFDGTIFDSTKLYNKFINIFNKYNIKKEYIKHELYDQNKNLDILANEIIKKNNLNLNILKELENIYSKNLVFKDVIPFLEKYYQKYDLILLTLGDKTYQQKKINESKLKKYFKDIIITNKDKSNLDNIDYTNGIFIDNNPIELEKFYNSNAKNLIRIKRNHDKYSKLNLNINNVPEYNNFNELITTNYIDNIGDEINE